jgi:hypothetical protein
MVAFAPVAAFYYDQTVLLISRRCRDEKLTTERAVIRERLEHNLGTSTVCKLRNQVD